MILPQAKAQVDSNKRADSLEGDLQNGNDHRPTFHCHRMAVHIRFWPRVQAVNQRYSGRSTHSLEKRDTRIDWMKTKIATKSKPISWNRSLVLGESVKPQTWQRVMTKHGTFRIVRHFLGFTKDRKGRFQCYGPENSAVVAAFWKEIEKWLIGRISNPSLLEIAFVPQYSFRKLRLTFSDALGGPSVTILPLLSLHFGYLCSPESLTRRLNTSL